jgi:hypothetical protein
MGKLNSFSFFFLMLAGDTNRLVTCLANEKEGPSPQRNATRKANFFFSF